MKRIIIMILAATMIMSGMTACSLFKKTCKVKDCQETDIYEDGYCKYHYYQNVGDTVLKDLINGKKEEQ